MPLKVSRLIKNLISYLQSLTVLFHLPFSTKAPKEVEHHLLSGAALLRSTAGRMMVHSVSLQNGM